MWETWVQSLGQEDPLEKEMATHSSTLAWEIPWTEEPDRLQSMGSQRVGHNWVTSLYQLYSDWWEVITHYSFDLHFCNNEQCWVSFHVFIGHLYVIFGEMSIYMLCPLFDWVVVFLVLSCVSCVPVFFIVLWQSSDLKTIWCPFYIGIVCRGQWLQINIETETFRIAV